MLNTKDKGRLLQTIKLCQKTDNKILDIENNEFDYNLECMINYGEY